MRRIFKGTEPASFSHWKEQANEQWMPGYPDLQNPQKRDLHNSLLQEQHSSCCYCGQEISLESSHIEHFKPQERYPEQALDYENLHASCLRETRPGNPLHCGHHKKNWFDEQHVIYPTDEHCEQRFRYLLNGNIQPSAATDLSAGQMIDVLALDIAYLSQRREQAINGFFDSAFLDSVTPEELEAIIRNLRTAAPDRQIPFAHVIARFAEQLLPAQ